MVLSLFSLQGSSAHGGEDEKDENRDSVVQSVDESDSVSSIHGGEDVKDEDKDGALQSVGESDSSEDEVIFD